MKIKELYQKYKQTYQVSTDTRNIKERVIFFALKGTNFDANQFADEALRIGASYVVIDDESFYKSDNRYVLVDDVLKTLQNLAKYHRQKLGIPIIALTGSNGKTTTKELINSVLSKQFKTTATRGNLNNHIGVPLTLLSMTPSTEISIVEMGANHFGEIASLCEIAMPDYGYITNFGKAHLEGFGSLKGVIRAKTELYTYLKKTDGIAFVNKLDSNQVQQSLHQKRYIFGDLVKNLTTDSFVKIKLDELDIGSNLLGSFNYDNVVAAVSIGLYFKVPKNIIKQAIEEYIPNNKRSQLISIGNTKIILDAYNANPTSMYAALSSFKENPALNKIIILGDMFELGISSDKEHQLIADLAIDSNFKYIILIGENFYKTRNKNTIKYKEFDDFKSDFNKIDYENATILIKGSRGMALERIVELFS